MARGNHKSPQITKYPKRKDAWVKQLKQINQNNLILKNLKSL
jgi:hypothetical protein